MTDFLGKATVTGSHGIVENIRLKGYRVYTDLSTGKELVLHHGYPDRASQATPSVVQRALDFALQGKPCYTIIYVDNDAYEAYLDMINALLAQNRSC